MNRKVEFKKMDYWNDIKKKDLGFYICIENSVFEIVI